MPTGAIKAAYDTQQVERLNENIITSIKNEIILSTDVCCHYGIIVHPQMNSCTILMEINVKLKI